MDLQVSPVNSHALNADILDQALVIDRAGADHVLDLLIEGKAIRYGELARYLSLLNPFENPERRRAVIAAIKDSNIVEPAMPYDEHIVEWDDILDQPEYGYEIHTEKDKLDVAYRWARGQIPRWLAMVGSTIEYEGAQRTILQFGCFKDARGNLLELELEGGHYFRDHSRRDDSSEADNEELDRFFAACTNSDGLMIVKGEELSRILAKNRVEAHDDVREAFDAPTIDGQGHKRILAYAIETAREFNAAQKAKAKATMSSNDGLLFDDVADIPERAVKWLWKGRSHANKVGLLAGDGGLGKTSILLDMAYRISIGEPWPDGAGWAPKGTVLIINQEDDAGDTIKPRLRELGADMRKIKILRTVKRDGKEGEFNLQYDIDRLKGAIRQFGDVRLVIIDPLSNYLGDVNSWKESEVRTVLAPLKPLAEQFNVTIIGNMHLSKGGSRNTSNANLALLNSVGISSFARFILQVEADDENPDTRRVFGVTKLSVGKPGRTMAYGFKDRHDVDWPDLDWQGFTDKRIADLRGRSGRGGRGRVERDDAVRFLREMLADGPKLGNEVMQAAIAEGFKEATLGRARRELEIVSKPYLIPGDDRWHMALPDWQKHATEPLEDW